MTGPDVKSQIGAAKKKRVLKSIDNRSKWQERLAV